jgi:hypothetical protein
LSEIEAKEFQDGGFPKSYLSIGNKKFVGAPRSKESR